jgi:hypothetical protein
VKFAIPKVKIAFCESRIVKCNFVKYTDIGVYELIMPLVAYPPLQVSLWVLDHRGSKRVAMGKA